MIVALSAVAVLVSLAVLAVVVLQAMRDMSQTAKEAKAVLEGIEADLADLRARFAGVALDAEVLSRAISSDAQRVRRLGAEMEEAKRTARGLGDILRVVRIAAAVASGNPLAALKQVMTK
ncbi:MAG TPA: hypothetical protein VNX25_05100 [Verrucomicrobiae bacterium]|nr:hypothetical protein [Verrucomicrobiae bacterium]